MDAAVVFYPRIYLSRVATVATTGTLCGVLRGWHAVDKELRREEDMWEGVLPSIKFYG